MNQYPESRISFMGDTQLGGDKEQTDRMKDTQALVAEYKGQVDQAWHVGDLGSSSTAYEFMTAFKALGKEKSESISSETRKVQIEVQRQLEEMFIRLVEQGKEKAAKYIMGKYLRGQQASFPEVVTLMKEWAHNPRISGNPELSKFVVGKGEEAVLDMFKIITGKDVDFKKADERAMIDEMSDALSTMADLVGEDGKLGVVPGNQETGNWQRVATKVLPEFQRDVDLERSPSFHDVSENVGLISMPYELEKGGQFDPKALADQAEGKKAIIIGTHASPLLRGLAENIREPLSVEAQKEAIIKNLELEDFMDSKFDEMDKSTKDKLLRRAGGFDEIEFNGLKISQVVDKVADRLNKRSSDTYERRKAWDEERKAIIAKHGKPDRTPGTQPSPLLKEFRELVRSLPDSVETIVVPWGHLHSTSEKALADHPWFKFEEEVQPQSFIIADPLTGNHKEIKFIYLPTAAVVVMDCYPDGVVDIKSLKQVVGEIK